MTLRLGGIKEEKIEYYFFYHKDAKTLSHFLAPPCLGCIKENKFEYYFFVTKTPKQ